MTLKHIEHFDDYSILTNISKELLPSTIEDVKKNVRIKYDGAPAIVYGTFPGSNKFFVSTKSFYNVNDKKPYYSVSEILSSDNPTDLKAKLVEAFTSLRLFHLSLNLPGVYQGDIIFTSEEVQKTRDNSSTMNVIQYELPSNKSYQFGICHHSEILIQNNDNGFSIIGSKVATPLPESPIVYQYSTELSDSVCFSVFNTLHKLTQISIPALTEIVDQSVANNISVLYTKYRNECLRKDGKIKYTSLEAEFKRSVLENMLGSVKKLATATRFASFMDRNIELYRLVTSSEFSTWFSQFVVYAKKYEDIITELTQIHQLKDCEGLVLSLTNGDNVKLINRLEFTKNNFKKNASGFKK